MTTRPCKGCSSTEFIHDTKEDNLVCIRCGIVTREGIGEFTIQTEYKGPPSPSLDSAKDAREERKRRKLIDSIFSKESDRTKRRSKLKELCSLIEIPNRVVRKALMLFDTHEHDLREVHPFESALVACIVIATRVVPGVFIPMHVFRDTFTLSNVELNNAIKHVALCSGVNSCTIATSSIPYIISCMGLPYKANDELKRMYVKACRRAPSMGPNTRLALCCFQLVKIKGLSFDLNDIAYWTDTSVTSLQGHISKFKKRLQIKEEQR